MKAFVICKKFDGIEYYYSGKFKNGIPRWYWNFVSFNKSVYTRTYKSWEKADSIRTKLNLINTYIKELNNND